MSGRSCRDLSDVPPAERAGGCVPELRHPSHTSPGRVRPRSGGRHACADRARLDDRTRAGQRRAARRSGGLSGTRTDLTVTHGRRPCPPRYRLESWDKGGWPSSRPPGRTAGRRPGRPRGPRARPRATAQRCGGGSHDPRPAGSIGGHPERGNASDRPLSSCGHAVRRRSAPPRWLRPQTARVGGGNAPLGAQGSRRPADPAAHRRGRTTCSAPRRPTLHRRHRGQRQRSARPRRCGPPCDACRRSCFAWPA